MKYWRQSLYVKICQNIHKITDFPASLKAAFKVAQTAEKNHFSLGDQYSIMSFTDFFKENGGEEGEKKQPQIMILYFFVG